MVHKLTKIVEWSAPEFAYREKKPDWYWALGIIVVAGLVIAVFDKNFLLGILVVLAGGLILFFSQKKPDDISIEISDQGLKINSRFFQYSRINSFWIEERNDRWQLIINIHREITPVVAIPIPDEIEPDELRELLLGYIDEIEQKEPLSHRIGERLGL